MLLSLFEHHALAVAEYSADAVPQPENGVTIVLCALIFLMTISVVLFRRRLSNLIRSLYSQRFFSLLIRESKVLEEMMFPVTLLFDLFTIALGMLLIIAHFNAPLVSRLTFWGAYGGVFAVLAVVYILEFTANVVYAGLFDHQKERYSLNLYKFVFSTNVAMLLLPFLIVYHALGNFAVMYAFIPVFFVMLGLYLYRLLKINPRNINLFHFFLYFCTLEILPWVLLVKCILII
ncbi:MAG: DUF4271 domain-containing protein [Bacteroidales bacterium]|nr:DUF4271 domain-containing protein [Bacteroidales bacterium]